MADFTIKRNDTRPLLAATLTADNAPYVLTGASVRFIMKAAGAGTAKVDAAASIVDAMAGTVEYEWIATDTDTEGEYLGEFEVTDAGGKVLTFPNGHEGPLQFTIEVTEDLA